MLKQRIVGAMLDLGKPKDWNEERDGPCDSLPVRVMQHPGGLVEMQSAWQPTPEELDTLNRGGPVILTVCSKAHPPVRLEVEEPAADAQLATGDQKITVNKAPGINLVQIRKVWGDGSQHHFTAKTDDLPDLIAQLQKIVDGEART